MYSEHMECWWLPHFIPKQEALDSLQLEALYAFGQKHVTNISQMLRNTAGSRHSVQPLYLIQSFPKPRKVQLSRDKHSQNMCAYLAEQTPLQVEKVIDRNDNLFQFLFRKINTHQNKMKHDSDFPMPAPFCKYCLNMLKMTTQLSGTSLTLWLPFLTMFIYILLRLLVLLTVRESSFVQT